MSTTCPVAHKYSERNSSEQHPSWYTGMNMLDTLAFSFYRYAQRVDFAALLNNSIHNLGYPESDNHLLVDTLSNQVKCIVLEYLREYEPSEGMVQYFRKNYRRMGRTLDTDEAVRNAMSNLLSVAVLDILAGAYLVETHNIGVGQVRGLLLANMRGGSAEIHYTFSDIVFYPKTPTRQAILDEIKQVNTTFHLPCVYFASDQSKGWICYMLDLMTSQIVRKTGIASERKDRGDALPIRTFRYLPISDRDDLMKLVKGCQDDTLKKVARVLKYSDLNQDTKDFITPSQLVEKVTHEKVQLQGVSQQLTELITHTLLPLRFARDLSKKSGKMALEVYSSYTDEKCVQPTMYHRYKTLRAIYKNPLGIGVEWQPLIQKILDELSQMEDSLSTEQKGKFHKLKPTLVLLFGLR